MIQISFQGLASLTSSRLHHFASDMAVYVRNTCPGFVCNLEDDELTDTLHAFSLPLTKRLTRNSDVLSELIASCATTWWFWHENAGPLREYLSASPTLATLRERVEQAFDGAAQVED